MSKRVKTTKIVKKTKTGKEIEIQHAKVADRLLEFWKDNPRGSITPIYDIEGSRLIFTVKIIKDKSAKNSAEATGHAYTVLDQSDKQFEKLETVATGRALALLGYASSGEVASFEEMEEFIAYREARVDEIIAEMETIKDITKLREYFMSLGSYMAESKVIEAKDKRKAELSNETSRRTAE